MKVNFKEIIKITKKTCGKNITHIYSLPTELDKSIVPFLSNFGKPKFDLNTIKFLHIESKDDFMIKGRLNRVGINLTIAKSSRNIKLLGNKKIEFENNLSKWIENKLGISVIR